MGAAKSLFYDAVILSATLNHAMIIRKPSRKTMVWQRQFCRSMASTLDNNTVQASSTDDPKITDLKGLKSETSRIYLRTFKKVGKYSEKLSKQEDLSEEEVLKTKEEMTELQAYLGKVADLEAQLKEIRSTTDKAFPSAAQLAISLGIRDTPPPPQIRGEKKAKGKPHAPRKPYFPYKSLDGIIIRVGREAPDNDILSCDPNYRLPTEWWLHVSGMPGSHVVIRSSDDDLPEKFRETLKDAALLAAVNSKGSGMGKVNVTYTRCRNVSKPIGAKAGLVRLSGDVATMTVNIKAESARLERLLQTKGISEE